MKPILDFCGSHPWLTLLFAVAIYETTANICKTIIQVAIVLKGNSEKKTGKENENGKAAV
jgi:hypothetical protein